MFEIIKFLAETLLKSFSISSLAEHQKKKKLNEIGVELFLLYTALNEIFVLGNSIVDELENAISKLEEKKKKGEDDPRCWTRLNDFLPLQAQNIVKFVGSLKRLALELQVIAPEVYLKTAPLMHRKFNLVQALIYSLEGHGDKPILGYFDFDALEKIVKSPPVKRYEKNLNNNDYPGEAIRNSVTNEEIKELNNKLYGKYHKLDIPDLYSFDLSSYKTLKTYLKASKPRDQLDEIEVILKDLRKGIIENFSVEDILLEVGDKKSVALSLFIGF
jgi:hypothetical protein